MLKKRFPRIKEIEISRDHKGVCKQVFSTSELHLGDEIPENKGD
jgi:hypothetical protein